MVDDNSCPKCGCDGLTYSPLDWVDAENAFRDIQCTDCNFEGKAWYKIIFDGWEDINGNSV